MRLIYWKPGLVVGAIVLMFVCLCFPGRVQARPLAIDVGGTISVNTTWTKANSPYVVTQSVYVNSGVVLTIEPGVLVKFTQNTGLYIQGNGQLLAVGAVGEPIVFTSLRDDTYGGDTNGDGTVTVPAPGDWYTLSAYGSLSTLHLQHVVMRYSRTSVEAHGHLLLQDSTLEQGSVDGVYVYPNSGTAPNITIERSTIRTQRTGIYIYDQPGSVTLLNNLFDSANSASAAIELEKVVSGQIVSNTINVAGTAEQMRGILLNNVGDGLNVTNNTIVRSSNAKALAGIEVQNSRPQLTGNHVSGFEVAVLLKDGYPEILPAYSENDFSRNTYGNSVGVTGILKTGSWIQANGLTHFVYGTGVIEANATLTLPPGSTIKFMRYASLQLGDKSQLIARGTLAEPIVFTSIQDDEYGGDTNGDGGVTVPESEDWYGIDGYGGLSTIEMEHVLLRFASEAIHARGHVTLRDSMVEGSSTAVNINPNSGTAPTALIERALIQSSYYGIYLSKAPATLKISGNAFIGQTSYGIYNADSNLTVDATGNWWGNATGPAHDTVNPDGQGVRISDRVNIANWLTVEPTFVPLERPKPTANTPAASPDRYEANDNCSQAGALAGDGVPQEHTFHAPADADWIQFAATAGATYRIEVQTLPDSLADVNLELYMQCDTAAAETWQATFTPGVRLDFKPTQTGPAYLRLTNYDDQVYGSNAGYRVSVRPLNSTAQLGALIILAGRLKDADRLQANIHFSTQNVYNLFRANGYTDDNIHYLATDNSLPGWDAEATITNLQNAITSWAVDKVSAERPLTLYLMDHGGIDTFYVDGANNQTLAPGDLNSWLSQLEASVPGLRITVIVEACHSGSFIDGETRISKAGRMVITSTNVQNVAFASAKGAQFSDRLITALREGYSLSNSFWDAQYSVRRLYKLQEPWIDANGNGIPNEVEDGAESSQHNPRVDQTPADTWAPYIVTAQGPSQLIDGIGMLRAEVRDNKSVKRVWAVIYPPSYTPPSSVEELVPEDLPTIEFTAQGNHQYSAGYDNFTENGRYQIAFYAEDEDGLKARLLVLPVQNGNGGQVFLPLIVR